MSDEDLIRRGDVIPAVREIIKGYYTDDARKFFEVAGILSYALGSIATREAEPPKKKIPTADDPAINTCDISFRAINVLKNSLDIDVWRTPISYLIRYTQKELLRLRGIGRRSVIEIEDALAKYGYRLKNKVRFPHEATQ